MTTWKSFERTVAEWFNTKRNPLSGANNTTDMGEDRPGDIIYPNALVECKVYKRNATVTRAQETSKEASEYNLPFLHVERVKGDRDTVALCVSSDMAEKLVEKFQEEVETTTND